MEHNEHEYPPSTKRLRYLYLQILELSLFTVAPLLTIYILLVRVGVSVQEKIAFAFLLLLIILTRYPYILESPLARRIHLRSREVSLSQREQLLQRREQEMHAYYKLVRTINEVNDLRQQLTIIANAITRHFPGIVGCAIYLPAERDKASLQATSGDLVNKLSHDVETCAAWVLSHGESVMVQDAGLVDHAGNSYVVRVVANTRTAINNSFPEHEHYILPLYEQEKILGALYLILSDREVLQFFPIQKGTTLSQGLHAPQTEISYKILRLAVSIIERTATQQRIVEEVIVQRQEQLYKTVIYFLSHELRNRLTVIKGAATHLLANDSLWKDVERCRNYLEDVKEEADDLEQFVSKLATVSRIEGGLLEPEMQLYYVEDLEDLITKTVKGMKSRLQGCAVEVTVADIPPIELDPILIRHVLENLIENAMRHSGTRTPVEIFVERDSEHVLVTVADHGRGIPLDSIHHLFDRFLRSAESKGLGLGLAICKGIVEGHNGSIWAENRTGGGAMFHFKLPLSKRGALLYEEE